jgi:hypothetical protein
MPQNETPPVLDGQTVIDDVLEGGDDGVHEAAVSDRA